MLILKKFARDIPALIGLVIVVVMVVIAVIGPWIAPHPGDVVASHLLQRLKPPSAAFPFGTDNLGRDMFSRVILGTRGALEVALAVVTIAAAIGVPLGLIAGYTTGWLSEAIMRVTDVFLSLPQLMLALALTYWPFFTRLVFAETRRLRSSLFVDALQGIGAGTARIVFAHILPNAISPVIVRATIGLGFTILVAAVLGFLGVGATPPQPDWGLTISESRNYLPDAWWYATFPGLAILVAVLGFNLLGDGLRDLVDPRLRRSR